MINKREQRIRFSDALASRLSQTTPIGLAQALARAEGKSRKGYIATAGISCPHCPYFSYSFHESSAHARLHPITK